MNRFMFDVRRMEWVTPAVGVILGIAAAVLIIYGANSLWNVLSGSETQPSEGRVGETPGATRLQLRHLSDVLVAANRTGDPVLAEKIALQVVSILGVIERQPDVKITGSPMYHCSLAARHLRDGALAIRAGGRWLGEDRFQAAASSCRE